MTCKPFRSMLFVISIVLMTPALAASERARCPTTMMLALGPKNARKIQASLEKSTANFHPNLDVVPSEVANTAGENLPTFKRSDHLNPMKPKAQISVDTYFGDYTSSSPDVFVLPKDPLLFCTLSPGRAVFLSDGVTHHYAIVYRVDYAKNVVTLIDRWAPVSFLLPNHNVAGVKARSYTGPNGQPFLDISFDDFSKVLSGTIEAIAPYQYFETMEKLYPRLGSDPNYLIWKLSRKLAAGSFDTDLFAILEAEHASKGVANRKLDLLQSYANDKLIGVVSGFTVSAPGRANAPELVPKAREEFVHRLDDYASTLPWTLKWLLVERAEQSDDKELRLRIVDAFLKTSPHDVDFQIARAGILFQIKRSADALAQLVTARKQWESDVEEAIAVSPPEKALQFFFADDYGLMSFDVFRWRYARIELLRTEAELLTGKDKTESNKRLSELLDKYKSNLLQDFFGDLIEIAWLSDSIDDEVFELKTALSIVKDDATRDHIAEALYGQFAINQPITALPASSRAELKRSTVGKALCEIVGEQRITPDASASNEKALRKFCVVAH